MAHEATKITIRTQTPIFELQFSCVSTITLTRMKALWKFELLLSSYSRKLPIKFPRFSPTTCDMKPTGRLCIWIQKGIEKRGTLIRFSPFLIAPKINMCLSKLLGPNFCHPLFHDRDTNAFVRDWIPCRHHLRNSAH